MVCLPTGCQTCILLHMQMSGRKWRKRVQHLLPDSTWRHEPTWPSSGSFSPSGTKKSESTSGVSSHREQPRDQTKTDRTHLEIETQADAARHFLLAQYSIPGRLHTSRPHWPKADRFATPLPVRPPRDDLRSGSGPDQFLFFLRSFIAEFKSPATR